MTALPLFYRSIEPLNSVAHRERCIAVPAAPFAFAAAAHLIPAVVEEFTAAARELPILFAPAGKHHSTVFLCGLKPGKNLFVDADGRWSGAYVPAYLRRYPFMLGEREGADPIICIDPTYAGFGTEGQRLFDADGSLTPPLASMVRLVTDFAAAARHTEAMCARLDELGLLKSITIDVQQQGVEGGSASIHGLSIVDEQKLNALPDDVFAELRAKGYLGPVYAHLFSIGATEKLAAKMAPAKPADPLADALNSALAQALADVPAKEDEMIQ